MKKIPFFVVRDILVTICMMLATVTSAATACYEVVPRPRSIEIISDAKPFKLDKHTKIVCKDSSLAREARFLQEYIENLTGFKPEITIKSRRGTISIETSLKSDNPEGYEIKIDSSGIHINGASAAGVFYGIQALRKSIPAASADRELLFPAASIKDEPFYGYRGAHLDVSRHPMETDSVKAYIDMLALHNINRFHWHLTDDQGWRIEIKKWPKLTEVGSHRDGTMIGMDWNTNDSIPVDGFYTQAEAADIVAYAAERHITVIPEIDLPGHMQAAVASYPELGCTGGPYKVWHQWGCSFEVLCGGNDLVYQFLTDVLNEIADIFPSEVIHIGGDECHKDRWEVCPKCQAKIAELGLTNEGSSAEAKLQTHVMKHAQEVLAKRGRSVMGWDEILEGGIPGNAMVMSWRGTVGGIAAARLGHDVVFSPTDYCYFNYCQSDDPSTEPFGFREYIPLEKVYTLNPNDLDLTPEQMKHIKGVQCNLWREFIDSLWLSQYMVLPRMAAVCEVQWMDPADRDYGEFLDRLSRLAAHYDVSGYKYRKF